MSEISGRRVDTSKWIPVPEEFQTTHTVQTPFEQLEIPELHWWQDASLDLIAIEGLAAEVQRLRPLKGSPYLRANQEVFDPDNTLPK